MSMKMVYARLVIRNGLNGHVNILEEVSWSMHWTLYIAVQHLSSTSNVAIIMLHLFINMISTELLSNIGKN